MTLKTFLIGMLVSFGLAWTCMIAIPAAKMSAIPAVKMDPEDEESADYQRMVSGRIENGARIYAKNGCYYCHSQLIRPEYLGRQLWRDDVAGIKDGDDGDTRRETSVHDYEGEKFAQIGRTRMGPDLSNFGHRAKKYAGRLDMSPEQWVIAHLYNPRNSDLYRGTNGQKIDHSWSSCPSQPQMFDEQPVQGQGDSMAMASEEEGYEIIPNEQARLLTSYLLSLKRDDELPKGLAHPVEGEDKPEEKK